MYKRTAGLVLLAAVMAGCGDSPTTAPTPPTPPPTAASTTAPARPANIQLEGSYNSKPRRGEGTRIIAGHFTAEVHQQLRVLAAQERNTIQGYPYPQPVLEDRNARRQAVNGEQ